MQLCVVGGQQAVSSLERHPLFSVLQRLGLFYNLRHKQGTLVQDLYCHTKFAPPPFPGTKTAIKMVPLGTNLVAEIGPPCLVWLPFSPKIY